MAVKTITIDIDAYERLSRAKRQGQSFSQVIKERFPPVGSTGADLLRALDESEVSDETLDAVEDVVRARRDSPVRVPKW